MKTAFTTTDINGNEVTLSMGAVDKLAKEWTYEGYKDDILAELDAFCEDNELDADKITNATVEDMINFRIGQDDDLDEEYSKTVDAIWRYEDRIRAECDPSAPEKAKRKDDLDR